jgi:hypothetical protein
MKRSITVLLLWAACAFQVQAQIQFSGTERVWSTDFEKAVEIANADFEGALFVLAYRSDDSVSTHTAQNILGSVPIREYLDANFSLVAIDMDSEDWTKVQVHFRYGHTNPGPYVLIDVPKHTNSGSFIGWESTEGDLTDILEILQEMKTQPFDGFGE